MDRFIYLKEVVSLRVEEEKCIGCGVCVSVCPRPVLHLDNGRVRTVNRDACIECGACARNCPVNAINVRPGPGCAVAVINQATGRKKSSCSFSVPPERKEKPDPSVSADGCGLGCC